LIFVAKNNDYTHFHKFHIIIYFYLIKNLKNINFQVLPISAFGLGTWQVRRKIWKENLIQELKSKTKLPALDFPEKLESFPILLIVKYYK